MFMCSDPDRGYIVVCNATGQVNKANGMFMCSDPDRGYIVMCNATGQVN